MFSLRDFVKKGFLDAIGKMADYQIILNAAGWHEKGVLTEEDLSEINQAMENYVPEGETENE
ncbi:MAG: hypothetical protein SOY03_07745 [Bariatricus sp.]|nr:hypothetical protein [Bariatricus sp.]